jgi:hypothetical protein
MSRTVTARRVSSTLSPGKSNFNYEKKGFMNYAILGAGKDQAGGSK